MSRVVEKTFTALTSGGVGHPDFGQPLPIGQAPVGTVYTLTDMGELAARLGSINTFDRRGNVLWMDNFEDSIAKWGSLGSGTGASAALSTEAARNGAKSGKLITPSDTDDYIQIARRIGVVAASKIGFEISFADQDINTKLDILFGYYDGTYLTDGILRYVPDESYFQIYVGLDYVTLATVPLISELYAWNTCKVVIDMETNKYVRCILNNTEYDISEYNLLRVATPAVSSSSVVTVARLTREVASNLHVYVDDAIVTQNEPEND